MIEQDNLLEQAVKIGEIFRRRMTELQQTCELIRDVRVAGVMIGIELSIEGAPLVKAAMERKLLINCTHGTVLRLLPAMNLSPAQAEEACDILAELIPAHAR